MARRERGEGKLGLFILLAVLASVAFFLVKWVPPRLNAYEFRDYMGQWNTDPDKVMRRAPPDAVQADLYEKALALNLPIERADIQVTPMSGKFNISVKFDVVTDLKVYKKVDHYDFKALAARPAD